MVDAVLAYDPETGAFTYKVARGRMKPGDRAGYVGPWGYVYINIYGQMNFAHRLAWLAMTGGWPPQEVDHEDLNRANNRWKNIRACTPMQNGGNRPLHPQNKSGFKGVCFDNRAGRWLASIGHSYPRPDGTIRHGTKHLGHFDTAEEAAQAYEQAAIKKYGEFARIERREHGRTEA